VPTEDRAEISKGSDCAPAEGEISENCVVKTTSARAKVKGGTSEDTIDKIRWKSGYLLKRGPRCST